MPRNITIDSLAGLLAALRVPGKDGKPRQVYRGTFGGYWITWDANAQVSEDIVNLALLSGIIVPTRSELPDNFWSISTSNDLSDEELCKKRDEALAKINNTLADIAEFLGVFAAALSGRDRK